MKLPNTKDQNGNGLYIGDYVKYTIYNFNKFEETKICKFTAINGGYLTIRNVLNRKDI